MKKIISIIFLAFVIASCSSFAIQQVKFGWPIESVLKIDSKGDVNDNRFALSFNVIELFKLEMGENPAYNSKEIRVLRDNSGFYYITAKDFKNIYLLVAKNGTLTLETKFLLNETGLTNPVLNQREEYIELIDNTSTYKITNKGFERK